ncbi:MAG: heparinase II/III-family protein [Chromatiales bacterium]|nr:heparinase II/III-family protein [Chromatiales bacterium]
MGSTIGEPLKDNYMVLPESGWAFYRNKWQDKNDFYFLAKCGYKSDYHRQDDDTSFVLYFKGEEWITDGGLYNYQETDSERKFIRSYHAHSMSAPVDILPIRKKELF